MSSQEIVKIIEAELKRKNISKAQFYNDVGIKAGHMSNWRKGSNYPSVKMMIKISEYLGLDLLAQTENPATDNGDGDERTAKREEINRLLDADALTLFCRLQSICTHECEEPNATA